VEFRQRDWFTRRACQIPDEWVAAWRKELEDTGTLTLEHYADLVLLDYEQVQENIYTDLMLSSAYQPEWFALNNQGFLRFYLRLDKVQRALIWTEDGLDPRMLRPDQWQCYSEMFQYGRRHTWDMAKFQDPGDKRVDITVRQMPVEGSRVIYRFKVRMGDGEERTSTTWDVMLPKVKPKPKADGVPAR